MEHNKEQTKKDPTWIYSGGTGAFTIIWMLLVIGFIFWLLMYY